MTPSQENLKLADKTMLRLGEPCGHSPEVPGTALEACYECQKSALLRVLQDKDDAVEGLAEALEKIKVNPYPTDIFTEPTADEWEKAHEHFKSIGFPLDKISGAYGRKLFQWARDLAQEALAKWRNLSDKT